LKRPHKAFKRCKKGFLTAFERPFKDLPGGLSKVFKGLVNAFKTPF
jgi:hypothetical protein